MINFENEFRKTNAKSFKKDGLNYMMMFELETKVSTLLDLYFISSIPLPRQGFRVDCDKDMEINNMPAKSFVLWMDTSPSHVELICQQKTTIVIRNVWKLEDNVEQSWHGGGAMRVEWIDSSATFFCNSTLANDKCLDLIFKIKY